MNRRWRRLVLFALAFLCVTGWFWRYHTLNSYYAAMDDSTRIVYKKGEIVPFGQDYIETGVTANGYSIRVDDFAIMDFDELLHSLSAAQNEVYTSPDAVALVYATLFNEESDAEGIMLTDFDLHGIDNYANIDWELLDLVNPILEGSKGISLSPHTEYRIVLPFALYEEYVGDDTWKKLEAYEWFLHITVYPAEKDIKVQ